MNLPLTRRDFLARSSAVAASVVLGARAKASEPAGTTDQPAAESPPWEEVPPAERVNIAFVGCGGRGHSAIQALGGHNVIALCDVDENRCNEARQELPKAPFFRDYRRMFDAVGREIEAVVVATPDHMHFPIAMAAIALGKHVFVEKPLTHTVWEARQLRDAARHARVATQMGNQGHANEGTRLMREWVQAGVIGNVREVHHWTDRPIWPQGVERPDHSKCIPVVPDTLSWDLWLGVAPERAYDPLYVPFNWRGRWDFGTGALGDMGCHIMDAAFWALDLDAPEWVEAFSTPSSPESPPKASFVTYQYPARGAMPPVQVHWYDGGLKPRLPESLPADFVLADNGSLLIGDKGVLMSDTYNASVRLVPEERMQEFAPHRPPPHLPRVRGGHYNEWIAACKGGPAAGSNFDYSSRLTEAVLLGNVAIRSRHRVHWDSARMRITNDEPANQFIRTDYRPGWSV